MYNTQEYKLVVLSSSGKHRTEGLLLSREKMYNFGSDQNCEIVFQRGGQNVQPRHCRLFFDTIHGKWMLRRETEECEVFLNGKPVKTMEAVLRAGKVIKIERREFKFVRSSKRPRDQSAEGSNQKPSKKRTMAQNESAPTQQLLAPHPTPSERSAPAPIDTRTIECQTTESSIEQAKNPNHFVERVIKDTEFFDYAMAEIRKHLEQELRQEFEARLKEQVETQVRERLAPVQQYLRQQSKAIEGEVSRMLNNTLQSAHSMLDVSGGIMDAQHEENDGIRGAIPSPLRSTQRTPATARPPPVIIKNKLFTTTKTENSDGYGSPMNATEDYTYTPLSKMDDSEHDGSPIRLDFLTEEELQLIFKTRDALYNGRKRTAV